MDQIPTSAPDTLDQIEARAQRHLDGMTVNRDAMARDVLRLAQAIRSAQKRATGGGQTAANAGFSDAIAGIFSGIFDSGRR